MDKFHSLHSHFTDCDLDDLSNSNKDSDLGSLSKESDLGSISTENDFPDPANSRVRSSILHHDLRDLYSSFMKMDDIEGNVKSVSTPSRCVTKVELLLLFMLKK